MTDGGVLVASKESGTTMSMVRRDGEQCINKDVTVLGEQSREDAPQKPDCPAIRYRTFSGQLFRKYLLSLEMCAQRRDRDVGTVENRGRR
jgi:hypothetical protein